MHAAQLMVLAALAMLVPCAMAEDAAWPDGFWQTPAIQGYGRIHEFPNAAYRPDKSGTYKIVFALSRASKTPDEVNPGLDRVARTVNLYVASGVPLSHLKFVAVASGDATAIVLDDAHYRATLSAANPNLALIAALRKAGVEVTVCGQAVAEHQYEYGWIDQHVTTSLSALTTITVLQERGYVLMPL